MRFILGSFTLLCAIISTIASPFPVDVNVDVGTGAAKSPQVPVSKCNDAKVRVSALGLNVDTVICLSKNDSMPPNAMHASPSTDEICSLVDAKIRALGLDIRAVVCLKDRIDVFVNVQ